MKKLKSRVEGRGSRVVGQGARGSRGFSRYTKKNEMNRALGHLCAHIG